MRRLLCIAMILSAAACDERAEPAGEVSVTLPPPAPFVPPEAPSPASQPVEPPPTAPAPAEPPSEPLESVEPPSEAAEPAPAPPAATPDASDRPPLAAATMAATIRRIGYDCPEIVSTAPMADAEPGTRRYRITCSSGDAYRGTVQGGTMRFRKL